MRRKTIVARLRKLGLAILACLVFAVLAPMYFAERRSDESFTISSVFAAPRDRYVLTVPVRLSDAPDLTLVRSDVYDYGPAAAGGTADGKMSHILLDGPVFVLNAAGLRASSRSGRGESADADLGPVAPLIQQIVALGFELVTIRGGTLHVRMADGTVESLSDIQAVVTRPSKGQIACKGSFIVRGQRLKFKTTLGEPLDKKSPHRRSLEASFEGSLIEGNFSGYAGLAEDLRVDGETEISTPSLRRIGKWFGLPLETTEGFNAATIKAELTWAGRSLAFEKARIVVDGNEANGRLVLNLSGDRPLVDATLDFSRLDLAPYMEAARFPSVSFVLSSTPWSSFDMSLPMIRYLDADLRVSARQVAFKGYTFGKGAATIAAHAGKLQADLTELELHSGSILSAQVTAIMSELVPRYALRAKLENLDVGRATDQLMGAAALTGRATLTADLTSSGRSLDDIVKRLSGKATLAMPKGGRLVLDAKALREATEAGAGGWARLATSLTSLERLEATALIEDGAIKDGVAIAETKKTRSGSVALAARGRFGLDDGNMDVRLTLKPVAPPGQPPKPVDVADGETITLRGPWYDPVVRREDSETVAPR